MTDSVPILPRIAAAVLALFALPSLPAPATAADSGVLGALIGAGAGAVIGHQVNRRGGAGQGAIIGALGGYLLGKQIGKGNARPPAQAAPRSFDDCAAAERQYNAALKTRDIERKVYLLQNSVRLCTGSALYHNDLGVAYYQRNRPYDRDRARAELEQALRIDPDYQVARQNLNAL
ncbi:MAG: glycine zipper 2TM domain-containing protein [Zetaproteobacteria bacterium]|nr:MAG: glycine zipper 2TM domain-containing protein [Zetaproteobacteria bacterium]